MVSLAEMYVEAAAAATAAVSSSAAADAGEGDAAATTAGDTTAEQQQQQHQRSVSLHAAETAEAIGRYWAEKAAATGDGRGLFFLARLNEEGIGGPPRRQEAAKVRNFILTFPAAASAAAAVPPDATRCYRCYSCCCCICCCNCSCYLGCICSSTGA